MPPSRPDSILTQIHSQKLTAFLLLYSPSPPRAFYPVFISPARWCTYWVQSLCLTHLCIQACNKYLQNALCSDGSSSSNHPDLRTLLWFNCNSQWGWWKFSPGSVLLKTRGTLTVGAGDSWPGKTAFTKGSETATSLLVCLGFLPPSSSCSVSSSLSDFWQGSAAQCAEPWTGSGEDGLPVLVTTISMLCSRTHFSVLLAENDSIPN